MAAYNIMPGSAPHLHVYVGCTPHLQLLALLASRHRVWVTTVVSRTLRLPRLPTFALFVNVVLAWFGILPSKCSDT